MAINNERKEKENIVPELSVDMKKTWSGIASPSGQDITPKTNNFINWLKKSPLGSRSQPTISTLEDIKPEPTKTPWQQPWFTEMQIKTDSQPIAWATQIQPREEIKEEVDVAPTPAPTSAPIPTTSPLEAHAQTWKSLYEGLLSETTRRTTEKEDALRKTKEQLQGQLSSNTWSGLAPELEEKITWPYKQLLEQLNQEKELSESDLDINLNQIKATYDDVISRTLQTNKVNKDNMQKLAAITGFWFSTTWQEALADSLQRGVEEVNKFSTMKAWMIQKYANQDRQIDIDYMKDIINLQATLDTKLSDKYSEVTSQIQSVDADLGKTSDEGFKAIKEIVKDYMDYQNTEADNLLNQNRFKFDQYKFQKEENRRANEDIRKKQNDQLSRLFSSWDIMNMSMDNLMTVTQNLDLSPTDLILLQQKQLNWSVKALNDYGSSLKIWDIWTDNIDQIQKRITAWDSPADIINSITSWIIPEQIKQRQLEIWTRTEPKPEERPRGVTRWAAPVWVTREWEASIIDRGQNNPYLGKIGWSLTFRTNNPWALTATSTQHADRLAQKYGAIPGLYSLDANNDYVLNFDSKEAGSKALAQNLQENYGNLTLREVAPKWAYWQGEAHLSRMQQNGLDLNKRVNDLTPEEFSKLSDSISQAEVFDEGQTVTPTQTLGAEPTPTPTVDKYDDYEIRTLNEGKSEDITPEEARDFYNTKAQIFDNPDSSILDVLKYSRGQSKLSDTFVTQLNKAWIVSWQLGQLSNAITKGKGWKTQPVYDEEGTLVQPSEDIDLSPITGWFAEKNPWDKDAQSVRAILNQSIPNIARWIYGEVGVLSDQDIQFYTRTLPNLQQTDDVKKLVLAATLRVVRSWVDNQMRNLAGAWRDVSNLGTAYKKIDKQLKELEWELGINGQELDRDDEAQGGITPFTPTPAPEEATPTLENIVNSYRIDTEPGEIDTSENIINSTPINYNIPTPEQGQDQGVDFGEPWRRLGQALWGRQTAEEIWRFWITAADPTGLVRWAVRQAWETAWVDVSWIPESQVAEYAERTYWEPIRQAWTWIARIWEKAISLATGDPKEFSTNIYEDILDVWEGSLQAWLGLTFPATTLGMDVATDTESWKATLETIGKGIQLGWRVVNMLPWLSDFRENLPEDRRADFDAFVWGNAALVGGKLISKKNPQQIIKEYEAASQRGTQLIARPTPTQVKFGIAESGKRGIDDVVANLKTKDPTYADLLKETQKLKWEAYSPLKKGLDAVKWVYKNESVSWALNSLKEVYEGVKSEASRKIATEIDDLIKLNETTWLTLSQVNRVKTLHTQANKLFEAWKEKGKTFNADDMRSLRTEIKNFVETEAAKKWFTDVKEINQRYWDLADAELLLKDKVAAKEVAESKVPLPTRIENFASLIEKIPFASSTVDWMRQILGTRRGGQSLSVLEVESKLPQIIKQIQKTEKPSVVQQFVRELRKAWVNVPKVIWVEGIKQLEE